MKEGMRASYNYCRQNFLSGRVLQVSRFCGSLCSFIFYCSSTSEGAATSSCVSCLDIENVISGICSASPAVRDRLMNYA